MKVIKERLKSILLVALVISSMVLTQINLFDELMFSEGLKDEVDISSTKLSAYINPQSYFISFGGLSYTRVYDGNLQDDIWNEIRPFILSCFLNYETVQEIKREEYIKAFSDGSMLVRMPLDLSISQYFSIFSDEVLSDKIRDINPREYLLREGNVRSLYIFDKVTDKYYHIMNTSETHDIAAIIDTIKSENWIEYRKISDRFSLESTVDTGFNQLNYELIPYQNNFLVNALKFENEVSLDEDKFNIQVSNISSSVFGNRLDFVKKLKDVNDSVILMYGYGDKSLTVAHDGTISFRKKLDVSRSEAVGFKEALALAAGKIEQFGEVPEGLFLADYSEDNTSNIYTFYFNYKINSFSIAESFNKNYSIVVVVEENQVVAVTKNIKRFVEAFTPLAYQNTERLFTVDDCIIDNFLELSIYYQQDNNIFNSKIDSIEYYFKIRSEISGIDLRYITQNNETEKYMIPAWQVIISGRTYLFNAYNGKLISTYR